jgi:hypothetical protein
VFTTFSFEAMLNDLSIRLYISISGHLQHLAQSAIKPDHGMNQRYRNGVSLLTELPTELDQHDINFDWLPVQNECQHMPPVFWQSLRARK